MNKRRRCYIAAYVSLFVALILQTTLMRELDVFGVSPSIILVLVICFSLMNDIVPSAVFAVTAGLLLDISGGRVLGFNALLMMYLSIAVVIFGRDFFRETSKAASALVTMGTVLYELVYFIFSLAIFGNAHFFYMFVRVIIPEAVYNAAVAVPIYYYVNRFMKIKSGHSLID